MTEKDEIKSIILKMSKSYNPFEIFRDWVTVMSISISNATSVWNGFIWTVREKEYQEIMLKYKENERNYFSQMTELLVEVYQRKGMQDALGSIFMESGCGNGKAGQFFTPYQVSIVSAQIAVAEKIKQPPPYIFYDSCCGSGSLIIASAQCLDQTGINYQKNMKVIANDLDWLAVHMTHVQLSFLGINAIVTQGDAIEDLRTPRGRILRTPNNMGVLM